jgi:hypothetical protein
MTFALPALGVTLAAFAVWLTVRIINRRERWAIWTAVLLVALVGYPLSMGPTTYAYVKTGEPDWLGDTLDVLDWPIYWAFRDGPLLPRQGPYAQYVNWWWNPSI